MSRCIKTLLLAVSLLAAMNSFAQAPKAYGTPVTIEAAKKAAAAALEVAKKNGWFMAVAIVDPSGNLVYFEGMENTQTGSPHVAQDKARGAALYKRPTKVFQDAVSGGGAGVRLLGLPGAIPIEGG